MSDPDKRGILSDLIQKPIRLRKELIRQIDELRGRRGQTFQTFVQIAIIKALSDAKTEDLQEKQQRKDQQPQPQQRKASRGLGISEHLSVDAEAQDFSSDADEQELIAPQAPVVVNVGSTSGGRGGNSNPDVMTLARMVVEGAKHDRRRLLESAVKALASQAPTVEERIRLAEQLDEEIKRLDVPTTALERVRARMKK